MRVNLGFHRFGKHFDPTPMLFSTPIGGSKPPFSTE
jgi:hypothetical protein